MKKSKFIDWIDSLLDKSVDKMVRREERYNKRISEIEPDGTGKVDKLWVLKWCLFMPIIILLSIPILSVISAMSIGWWIKYHRSDEWYETRESQKKEVNFYWEKHFKKRLSLLKILCEVIREVFLINFFLVLTLFGCFLLFLLTITIGPKTCRDSDRDEKRLSELRQENANKGG
ncbi:MAG TPA: hypothetical protein ENI23_00495 [bacterium]|nr:hypothetical protein [bacterium]